MTFEYSLLTSIFGTCSCACAFCCKIEVDRYGIVLWTTLLAYNFKHLGYVCKKYYVPATQAAVKRNNLSEEVGICTIRVWGASVIKALVSMWATFLLANEMGIGTVFGSAIFKILAVVGYGGYLECKDEDVLRIWWCPLIAGGFFVILAILEVMLVLQDEKVAWWEGLIMLLTYLISCVYMKSQKKLLGKCGLLQQEGAGDTEARSIRSSSPNQHFHTPRGLDNPGAVADVEDLQCVTMGEEPPERLVPTPSRVFQREGVHRALPDEEDLPRELDTDQGHQISREEVDQVNRPIESRAPMKRWKKNDDELLKAVQCDSCGRIRLASYKLCDRCGKKLPRPEGEEDEESPFDEFAILIDKSRGGILGAEIDPQEDGSFLIEGIIPGLLETHNAEHPDKEVKSGDWIVEVNRISGNLPQMLGQVKRNQVMELKLRRKKQVQRVSTIEEPRRHIRDIFVDPFPLLFDCTMSTKPKRWLHNIIWGTAYILIISYLMVDTGNRFACILRIPPYVMGLTLIAPGTSIADMALSRIAACDGDSTFIANILSSVTFELLVGLGVPWMVRGLSHEEVKFNGQFRHFEVDAILIVILPVFFIALLRFNKWRLNRNLSAFLMSFYAMYLIYSIMAVYGMRIKSFPS